MYTPEDRGRYGDGGGEGKEVQGADNVNIMPTKQIRRRSIIDSDDSQTFTAMNYMGRQSICTWKETLLFILIKPVKRHIEFKEECNITDKEEEKNQFSGMMKQTSTF
jgi:hypothetical protein